MTSSLELPPQPKYATAPNPQLLTHGENVARVAARSGKPLLPWQAQVSEVVNEVDPSGIGWRYPTVILTTPRQCGKTTWLGPILAHRAIILPESRHWLTAQTGQAARETWRAWADLYGRAFAGRWAMRYSAGSERMTWLANGSTIGAFPPTPDFMHGKQSDTDAIDEPWAFRPEQGDALMQAIIPTQATRPWRQTILVSTAGDEDSTWWRAMVERGRLATADPAASIAYFEWADDPASDRADPVARAAYHPGYGRLTDDAAMNAALETLGPEGYDRAFRNLWPTQETSWRASWATLPERAIPPGVPVVLSADADPAHHSASISAGYRHDDGTVSVEVIDARPGVAWLTDRLLDVSRRNAGPEVVIHRTGPLGYLIGELQAAGVRVTEASSTDYGDAVARMKSLVLAGLLAHPRDPRLDVAVGNVTSRTVGDREVWARRQATEDITPFVAATFAAWRAATPPAAPVFAVR